MGKAEDESFLKKNKKIKYLYEGKLPVGIEHYYTDILNGNNIDIYMQMYALSKDDLIKYARISRILKTYQDVLGLMQLVLSDIRELDSSNKEALDLLSGEISKDLVDVVLNHDDNTDDTALENDYYASLIIYPEYIGEFKERTINAHSGREEHTQKVIASIIDQLRRTKYQVLRTRGDIHQVKLNSTDEWYICGNAMERIGSTSTKVCYVRIPLSEQNRRTLMDEYKISLDTLYLVVGYGDYKNEGCDEYQLYSKIRTDIKKHYDEILSIINMFKQDFTPSTLPLAEYYIQNGFLINEELLTIKKDKQSGI